jgi:hypothetical protein
VLAEQWKPQFREGNSVDLVMTSYYYTSSTENIHKKFISTAKFIAGFSLSASHR